MVSTGFSFGRDFNPYYLARPLLFRLDPEQAHALALMLLRKGFGPGTKSGDDPVLHTKVCGIDFPNPVGLAAGFDKNAEVIDELFGFGFGFAELGGVTPLPQPGNPKPRLFRLTQQQAIINRFGLNGDGIDAVLQRVIAWRDETIKGPRKIIGINIGKNKDSADAAADYVAGIRKFAPYVDYFAINVSSPNTPGLRDLQGREQLADLLKQVMAARAAERQQPPVLVKIAPDQTDGQLEDIAAIVLEAGVQGVIIGNTTIARPGNIPPQLAQEAGGLSGKPLFELSTQVLAKFYKLTQGKIPLIGCGGVSSGADAYAKIRAGASLVQLYTALIYEGPYLIRRIKRDLADLLKRDGFGSVGEAVGTAQK